MISLGHLKAYGFCSNDFESMILYVLLNLNENDYISVIFSDKKLKYCIGNNNGKYILDYKDDNYSKLLNIIIEFYKNNSYDIIINSSYKELILYAIKYNGEALEYANIKLQNDIEVVLQAVKQNGNALQYASSLLQNNKEIVLEAIKQKGYALEYASFNLQNDKEIVL